jgi:hypothetical protein
LANSLQHGYRTGGSAPVSPAFAANSARKELRKGVSLSENETITAQKFQSAFSSLAPLSAHIGRFKRLNQSSR